ncbi:hypothetical protein [Pelagibius sp.]|uniref:hypothetical protein n=1 Tax=Pelagibius sp. TaxID=1931238 RepID=UPI00261CD28C|nr:hypothetical protein [Pelagibius sp.]
MPYRSVSLTELPPEHPVAVFAASWQEAAKGRGPLPWSGFDPAAHKAVLPWLLLLKREPAADPALAESWHYALCGTGCTELFGFNSEGRVFAECLPQAAAAERLEELARLVESAEPLFAHSDVPIEGREFLRVFRGLFPFASDEAPDGVIDHVLYVIAREDERVLQARCAPRAKPGVDAPGRENGLGAE